MKSKKTKVMTLAICMVLLVGLSGSGAVSANEFVVNGVVSEEPPGEPGLVSESRTISYPPGATVINFDDTTQPCGFYQTIALTDEYIGKGVIFEGPGGSDGGAILNECGNFGVTGHSKPNFLAFNTVGKLKSGGYAKGPETIRFVKTVSYVQINAGSRISAGSTVTMAAFDNSGNPLGSDTITLSTTLESLIVERAGISKVVISSPGKVFVLDDLAFIPGEGPEPKIFVKTDKFKYCPCNEMLITIDISNPTKYPVTFKWYLGAPTLGYWGKIYSTKLPAGFKDTFKVPFHIDEWSKTPFSAVWYVDLQDPETGQELAADCACWSYCPPIIETSAIPTMPSLNDIRIEGIA